MTSTYELNFGMPYAITTMSLYLDVARGGVKAREYVVCVSASREEQALELASPGWHYSQQLDSKFCYLPAQDGAGVVRLPPLVVGREVSRIEVAARAWARGAVPAGETVNSVWATLSDSSGGSTIFQATPVTDRLEPIAQGGSHV